MCFGLISMNLIQVNLSIVCMEVTILFTMPGSACTNQGKVISTKHCFLLQIMVARGFKEPVR